MAALIGAGELPSGRAAGSVLLELESKIPLGSVAGRLDHLAVDLKRQRLFVAELGNNSVGVVDLGTSKVVSRLAGLQEPQGVGYEPSSDILFVANARDGSLRMFRGEKLQDAGRVELGDDADNVRIDPADRRVIIGFGRGALAVVDPEGGHTTYQVALDGHPESFRLETMGSRAFVNVPDARAIEVVNRTDGRMLAKWPTGQWRANFPMALDETSGQVIVVFRSPATLAAFSMADGKEVASAPACGDADDVFVDAKRQRIYVSCGDGFLDVFEPHGASYRRLAHLATASGARTSLYVPELERLFLAVRAGPRQPAELWVYRPSP
jgi:DNA-binding beta-propeller fold protein YncE